MKAAEPTGDARLSGVECALLVEDAVARVRHDVFNCLAAVRSASYYIQRRVSGSEAWHSDPRIEKFFHLISEQLDAAVERFGSTPKVDLPHRRQIRAHDGAESVRRAIEQVGSRLPALRLEAKITSGPLRADAEELVLAVAGTLEYLALSGEDVRITLCSESIDQEYRVRVEATGIENLSAFTEKELPRPLALARRAVLASGGQFRIERQAAGASVELTIPSGSSEAASLLIVDDDPAGRATLVALLELEQFVVHECATLAEARARIALGDEYAVVLLDRRLPDGVGDSLVPELRGAMPLAKIVLMTGESTNAVPAGFDAAHQKGLDPTTLLELVKSLLEPVASFE